MNRPSGPHRRVVAWAAGVACALSASIAVAGQLTMDTTIVQVAVNGGTDVVNQGTTCLRVSDPVAASCPGGFVAIPNNNKLLTGPTHSFTGGVRLSLGSAKEGITSGGY